MAGFEDADEAQRYGAQLLAGERAALRALHPDDLPVLEGWWADPTWAVLQTGVVRPRPVGGMAATFQKWSANDDPGAAGFSVVVRETGALAGHVGIWGIGPTARCASVGILIGPAHQGRGLGSDALRLTVRYAFAELGCHRVQLEVWAFNDRAIRAYTRAGFVVEGRRRDAVFHDGRFHDEILMGALAHEWPPA